MTKPTTRLRCLSGRSCWLARPRPRSGCSGFRFPRLGGTMSRDCEVGESWNPEVTCHKLPVTWHKLRVTCHMSHVTVIIQWFTGSERATRAQRPGYWGFQFPRHKITKNCGVSERQTRFLWPQDNEPLGWKPKEVLKLILRNDRIYLRIQEEGSQKVGDWKRVWTNIWTISWWLGTRISTNIWMIGNQDRGSKSLIIKFAFKFYFYRTK